MSKKYEKKIKKLKAKKRNHDHDDKKSNIDVRNIRQQSVKNQKKDLKNIKEKMSKSRDIW